MEDPKPEPVEVVVERAEIVYIQVEIRAPAASAGAAVGAVLLAGTGGARGGRQGGVARWKRPHANSTDCYL